MPNITLPDDSIPYPFGLKYSPMLNKGLGSWLTKNMAIVLGEEDLGPRTKPLSNGTMAQAQGPNCFERGKLLFQEAKKKSESLAIQFNWELITVPGVGHDNYNLAPRACMYLFGN